jgi:hypothetical protein
VLATATASVSLGVGAAPAYEHNWSCQSVHSAIYCQDVTSYHSWIAVQTRIDYNLNPDKICAYAWTEAGNQRTGSGCEAHDWVHTSCLSASTPYSHGLGDWYWPGQVHNTAGYATTPGTNVIC